MEYRNVTIFTGQVFRVPEHIVRLDSKNNRAWQVRYGSTKEACFPDGTTDGSGARAALKKATRELLRRIRSLPAPTGLRGDIVQWKNNKLPLGVSGPAERYRKGRKVKQYSFQVSLPRFGEKSRNVHVYIATENTICRELYNRALGKAKGLRQEAERKFQEEATKAMRARHQGVSA